MMNFDPNDMPQFKMPTKLLDKVFDLSGAEDVGQGILLSYLTQEGTPVVFLKTNSKVVEMGLRKAMETYLEDLESTEDLNLGFLDGDNPLDDDEGLQS